MRIISSTVLDLRQQDWPVQTVTELDTCLDLIATEITDYRVRPVEVVLSDGTGGPALFIGIGADASFAVYHSRKGNHFHSIGPGTTAAVPEFDVPARALIPVEDARAAIRQFLTTRCRPEILAWQQVEP
ncbi:MAG: Imm1 family immunity protein [Pseudonocardiaceae bacterium]